jgi:hypothetical protein
MCGDKVTNPNAPAAADAEAKLSSRRLMS